MSHEDRLRLNSQIAEIAVRKFCYSEASLTGSQGVSEERMPLLWGDWFVTGQNFYKEAPPKQQLLKLLQAVNDETATRLQLQTGGGETTAPPPVVFFSEMIEHIVALCRVLQHPKGHALLLGFGATGKQTVARLAACIRDFVLVRKSCRQLMIHKKIGREQGSDVGAEIAKRYSEKKARA